MKVGKVLLALLSFIPITLCSSLDAIHYDTFDEPSRTCEPITVDMCKGNGYNYTGGPNFLQEESYTQKDYMGQLYTFSPLIQSGCSKQLKPFLCTAYVPMCDPQVEQLIGPCRSVCENVKSRCQPILKQVGLPWPVALNCSVFPKSNTPNHMCMEFPEEDRPISTTPYVITKPTMPPTVAPLMCLSKKSPLSYKYINTTGQCLAKCDLDIIFTQPQKRFSEIWMAIWTSFCLLFSLLTVITFFVDSSYFPYPKRPIIFMSLSYTMYSTGYLVRLIAQRQSVICDSDGLMTQGLDNTNCAAIFLLLYYFSTAAALWWVILSLSWLLSAGFRWSHEAIDLYSSYYHLVAWGIPAVQSITIIVLRDISSDELTGLCFAGSSNPNSLLGFVIGPMAAYLLLGIGLLVAGYVISFCHDKKEPKKEDSKLEELMVRIGIFSLLYTVSTTCLLACYFYEYLNFSTWDTAQSHNTPSVEIFNLKTFSCLLPGITSGLSILSCKNFDAWSTVCGRPCFKRYNTAVKNPYQSNSNNNNNSKNSRQYIPVKVWHGSNSTRSQYGSGNFSRGYNPKHHIHMPTANGQPLLYQSECHV